MDASYGSSAAITEAGDLYIWGNGQSTPVKSMEDVSSVALGDSFVLALKTDGTLVGWGDNYIALCGKGLANSPENAVVIMENVAQIDASYAYALAVTKSGELFVWGENSWGVCGNIDAENPIVITPTKVMDNVACAAAGETFCLAVTKDSELYAWGNNDFGQLGNGIQLSNRYPIGYSDEAQEIEWNPIIEYTPIKILNDVVSISAGSSTAAAITRDGSLYLWGDNEYGQIGNGQQGDGAYIEEDGHIDITLDAIESTPLSVISNVKQVAASSYISAAIDNENDLYLWGNNEYGLVLNGQQGDGDYKTADAVVPQPYLAIHNIAQIAVGPNHAVALTMDGTVFAWGSNDSGQLGTDDEGPVTNMPVAVALNTDTQVIVQPDFVLDISGADTSLYGCNNTFTLYDDGVLYTSYLGAGISEIDLKKGMVRSIFIEDTWPDLICIYNGYMYYLAYDTKNIMRIKPDGTSDTIVYENTAEWDNESHWIEVQWWQADKYIFYSYFIENSSQDWTRIRIDMETGEIQDISDNCYWLLSYFPKAFDGQYYYYLSTTKEGFALCRMDANFESSTELLHEFGSGPLLFSGNNLFYFIDNEEIVDGKHHYLGSELYSIGIDGQNNRMIANINKGMYDDSSGSFVINAAGNYLYYTNVDDGYTLWRMKTDGTQNEKISDIANIKYVDIAAGRVFFIADGCLYSILPDGSDPVQIPPT